MRKVACPVALTPPTDKEYRKGVHWLETLRLRRIKTLENGYKVGWTINRAMRTPDLSIELGDVCGRVLGHGKEGARKVYRQHDVRFPLAPGLLSEFIVSFSATSTTQTQLSVHARSVVDKISPEIDASKLAAYIPRSLASAIPERTLYEHGQVGECNDLIFGFSLVDYAMSHSLQEGEAPKIVQICINEIDQRGLESEGIYRVHAFRTEFEFSH